MKTAISVPDETFDRASKRAAELGMSRSEFFTRAARRYLEQLDAASMTKQIDRALALAGDDDTSGAAVQAGRRRLARESEW
jgi:metal-responsive CopG/Arc/MetJ family transcriptional regulator